MQIKGNTTYSQEDNQLTAHLTLDIPNAQIATFIPDWNKVNQALISGKMDKEEYDMWLEDTLKLFNVPIDLTKTQQYLEWFKNKLYLNAIATSAKNRIVYRGQVYRCNLGVGIGSEECKERPCVVLQYNSANRTSPNTLVAPITHTTSTLPIVVPIAEKKDSSGKLILDGNVLLGNITCVSKARLSDYITDLSADEMKAVDKAISLSLGINHHYQTLQNMYDDKLQYIEKLKSNRTLLQTDLDSKQRQLDKFQELLDTYQFSDIQNLADFLEKSQKEM